MPDMFFGRHKRMPACLFALAVLTAPTAVGAKPFKVVHGFTGVDGAIPQAGLIADKAGNLFGATVYGGGTGCDGSGCGAIYKIAPDGTETVLYSFQGGDDGRYPEAKLVADKAGNLYGTTHWGGGSGCFNQLGCGTVFKLTPDGTETVLHAFNFTDGEYPRAGLVMDKAGNLYGAAGEGDSFNSGNVFKITSDGTFTILYTFTGGADGRFPQNSLILDKQGNFYGMTTAGGITGCASNFGCGTVFKVSPNGTETVLYAFGGDGDGSNPYYGSLIADDAGNFYGTTASGGGARCSNNFGDGCGTVFKLTPDGTETLLHVFTGKDDGANPLGNLVMDEQGNLYGTTATGGQKKCTYGLKGCGTVFELAPDGTLTTLHTFKSGNDGAGPFAGLVRNKAGDLYGTTSFGGFDGIVFKLKP